MPPSNAALERTGVDTVYTNPILLRPDRFTPLSRTPWAGRKIVSLFKDDWPWAHCLEDDRVGESWEFSCDPTFPSLLADCGTSLPELLERFPREILSASLSGSSHSSCEILLKLLNADMPLSLQVHPADDDPALTAEECGKPESWLVLDAEPGAGLYLGFSRPLELGELKALLREGGDRVQEALQFVPVKKGDYFEIEPGVPHAIGPGVTLLEPQRILFGRSGKTYRLWDWNRRYDAKGQLDQFGGQPRSLHMDEALRIIKSQQQVGEAFLAKTRRTAKSLDFGPLTLQSFPANPYYQVHLSSLAQGGASDLALEDGYAVILTLKGSLDIKGRGGQWVTLPKGQTALLPHAAWPLRVCSPLKASEFVLVHPARCTLAVS